MPCLYLFKYKRFLLTIHVSVQALPRGASPYPQPFYHTTRFIFFTALIKITTTYLLIYCQLCRGRDLICLVPAVAPTPKKGLAHSSYSINICWMNKWMLVQRGVPKAHYWMQQSGEEYVCNDCSHSGKKGHSCAYELAQVSHTSRDRRERQMLSLTHGEGL